MHLNCNQPPYSAVTAKSNKIPQLLIIFRNAIQAVAIQFIKPIHLLFLLAGLFLAPFLYGQLPPISDISQMPAVEWEKTLGGASPANANDVLVEPNGDIVAVGFSYSNNDIPDNHGDADGWFVKLDSAGNVLLKKSFGGSYTDWFTTVLATPDNGYLCIGGSYSSPFDMFQEGQGWMVKLSHSGEEEWSRYYGGTASMFVSATVLHDGSIAAILQTTSDLGGRLDWSVLKLDLAGNILWESMFVNFWQPWTNDMIPTIVETNNHKLLASSGLLFDEISGDTSRAEWNVPGQVTLLKKINGRIYVGTKDGDQNLAGYLDEGTTYNYVSRVWATDYSYSSGTGNPFTVNYYPYARGLAFLPSSASYVVTGTLHDNTRGGVFVSGVLSAGGNAQVLPGMATDVDRLFSAVAVNDGETFVCAGKKYDSQLSQERFWVVKYTIRNIIKGNVFLDINNNNVQDNGEPPFNNISIKSSKNGQEITTTTSNGTFVNFVDTGFYTTAPLLSQLPYFSASPTADTVTFTSFKNVSVQNFAIHKIADATDYSILLSSYTPARPGFSLVYQINYANKGTDIISNKTIRFIKDGHLGLVQTVPSYNAVSGDTLFWDINNIPPGGTGFIKISMTVNATIGETLASQVYIDSAGDVDPINNTDSIIEVVRGSFDPNDKSEIHNGDVTLLEVQNSQYLTYKIRFQNTGNDTAFNIFVRDTLDAKLDWASIEMVNASHSYQLKVKDGRFIEWQFNNILLVDSVQNEPASHGFITYRIKPKNTLVIDDVVSNAASIYFDYNAPVKTNTVITTVIKTTAEWTGIAGTNWHDPANWSVHVVPDGNTIAIIPEGLVNYPVVNGNAECFELRVSPNASITVNTGFNLEVKGK